MKPDKPPAFDGDANVGKQPIQKETCQDDKAGGLSFGGSTAKLDAVTSSASIGAGGVSFGGSSAKSDKAPAFDGDANVGKQPIRKETCQDDKESPQPRPKTAEGSVETSLTIPTGVRLFFLANRPGKPRSCTVSRGIFSISNSPWNKSMLNNPRKICISFRDRHFSCTLAGKE